MTDFADLRRRMVDSQIRPSEVTDYDVIKAFLAVPREEFTDPGERPFAYADRELSMSPLAPGRTMLVPVQLARLVQALPHGPETRALIIGCGTGYSAAILSELTGSVIAVEPDPTLASLASGHLKRLGAGNVSVVQADLTEGHPAGAPYDAILLEGAVEVVPASLIEQLKPDGALATIERRERLSHAMLYERIGEGATGWPLFEAWATILPGFACKPKFVF